MIKIIIYDDDDDNDAANDDDGDDAGGNVSDRIQYSNPSSCRLIWTPYCTSARAWSARSRRRRVCSSRNQPSKGRAVNAVVLHSARERTRAEPRMKLCLHLSLLLLCVRKF